MPCCRNLKYTALKRVSKLLNAGISKALDMPLNFVSIKRNRTCDISQNYFTSEIPFQMRLFKRHFGKYCATLCYNTKAIFLKDFKERTDLLKVELKKKLENIMEKWP